MVSFRSSWSGSKKSLEGNVDQLRQAIEPEHPDLSISRQCELLGLPRSSFYYQSRYLDDPLDLTLMHRMDKLYTQAPFYGSRRMTAVLRSEGHDVNRKRIQRLLREMGLEAIYRKPKTSEANPEHRKFPYLLRDLKIDHPNQVWSMDITYLPMKQGFLYLAAIIDWFSRYVLSWELSNSLETSFCLDAVERAFQCGKPTIFNTDQGVQFTSRNFSTRILDEGIQFSMDGRGRAFDNIFIERLWRSVKYEEVYLKDYADGVDAWRQLDGYFGFYNDERPHQSLRYRTPRQVHWGATN